MSNTYLTGNPLGSTSPKDLSDNASNIDEGVNSTSPSFDDRFLKRRLTWAGMEYEFGQQEIGRTSQFAAAQLQRAQTFQAALDAIGYTWVGDYAAGLVLDSRQDYFVRLGIPYILANSTPVPYTTTGVWVDEQSNFKALDPDATLRTDLALSVPGKGADLVSFKVPITGSVQRTTYGRLNEHPSVLDFGADLTGLSDSTGAFQLAAASTGRVEVPAGTYSLSQNVSGFFNLQNGVTFNGIGRALGRSRGFWTNVDAGADIHRLTDRVFVAEAAEKSLGLKESGGVGTWVTTSLGAGYLEREAHILCVSDVGEYGAVFATRTSDKAALGNYGDSSVAVAGVVVNDSASSTQIGWAAYLEANRVSNNTTFGVEIAVKNRGNNSSATPYSYFGGAVGAWFAGGGDPGYGGAPTNPSDTAILIGKNGAAWNKGIVIGATGISGTDGVTGLGTAIQMAKGHVIDWSFNDAGVARTGGQIVSEVNAPNFGQRLAFENSSFNIKGFDAASAPVDWFIFTGPVAAAGQSVCGVYLGAQAQGTGYSTVGAHGPDADIDVRIEPKGAGVLRFGYDSQANTSPGSFSATRRVTVKTEDGTTLYIPASLTTW